jgi:thioredoxin 1
MDILIRLGLALLIILGGVSLYCAWTRLRLHALGRAPAESPDLDLRRGVPAILYFTTPECVPCRTVQGPAIEELRAQFGDRLRIIKINAAERKDLADSWGVLSVPTTFIIDAQGRARHVNNGVVSARKLRQQLAEIVGLKDTVKSARHAIGSDTQVAPF